ncbi:MAG: restriction endonuclease [Chloroflexota bacterium]
MSKKIFRTLPLLPKNDANYLKTIELMLNFLNDEIYRTRQEFNEWIVDTFSCSKTSAKGYIQTLSRIGMVERKKHNRLGISGRGNKFFTTKNTEERALLVLEILVENYYGFSELLTYLYQSENVKFKEILPAIVSEYDLNMTLDLLSQQIYWASALGCVQQLGHRREYSLTSFGRTVVAQIEVPVASPMRADSNQKNLKQRVRWAARQTENPSQFEQLIADVFDYFGYDVIHDGGRGETDVIVAAFLGSNSYSFIIDTKARKDGKLYELEVMTIKTHQRNKNADFAIVISEEFGGNKIKTHAQEHSILLMPTSVLSEWIDIHERTPLNLIAYKDIVEQVGYVTTFPSKFLKQVSLKDRYITLLRRLIKFLSHAQRINTGIQWTPEQIHSNLAMEYHNEMYNLNEVNEVLDFLANPLVHAIIKEKNQITLCLHEATLEQIISTIFVSGISNHTRFSH